MHSHVSGALAPRLDQSPESIQLWQSQAVFPDGRIAPLYGCLATSKAQALVTAAGMIKAFPEDFAQAIPGAEPHAPPPPVVFEPLVYLADGSCIAVDCRPFNDAAECMAYARTWAEDRGIDYAGIGNRRIDALLDGGAQ